MQDGKPAYTYNWLGLHQYTVGATEALPAGKATIRYEFTYEGGGLGKGGTGTIFVNGKTVATGRIDQTQCCFFSADEGAEVGADEGTPVTEDYKVPTQVHRHDRQGNDRAAGDEDRGSGRGEKSSKASRPEDGAVRLMHRHRNREYTV